MIPQAHSPTRQTLLGAAVAVIGLAIAWGATSISSEAGYAGVGPNFLPWVVALALVTGVLVYGILNKVMGLRLSQEEEYEGADLSVHRIKATPEQEVSW